MHGNLRRRVAGRRVVLKVRGLLGISDVERIFCVLFGGIQDHLAEEGGSRSYNGRQYLDNEPQDKQDSRNHVLRHSAKRVFIHNLHYTIHDLQLFQQVNSVGFCVMLQ